MFDLIDELVERDCVFGFYTDLATELAPRGTNEQVVRLISAKKNGPAWLPGWRPGVFGHCLTLDETTRLDVPHPPIVDQFADVGCYTHATAGYLDHDALRDVRSADDPLAAACIATRNPMAEADAEELP